VNGEACGFGAFLDSNGSLYYGFWEHDKQNGTGFEIWEDNGKMTYSGDYV
jgi:hypothetical protein